MAFSLASFSFEFVAETDITLPDFSGSTFRGGFGNAFKRSVCIYKPSVCQDCPYTEKCAYLYVFETPVEHLKKEFKLTGNAPHPFVLEPDGNAKNGIRKTQHFGLNLNLIGKGLEFLPFFVFTFIRLGRIGIGKGRGKFSVGSVYAINGQRHRIYSAETDRLNKTYYSLFWQGLSHEPHPSDTISRIKISFETPTRIQQGGKYLDTISFELMIKSLLRRVRFLDLVHGTGDIEFDHQKWIDEARKVKLVDSQLRWNDWRRYSHRQKKKIFMGGVQGEVIYEGRLEPFWELLKIGEKIHVGKATSFGMGKYRVTQL